MEIRTAAELLENGVRARWEERAAGVDSLARRVLAAVLGHVVVRGDAPAAPDLAVADAGRGEVAAALERLDAADLLVLQDGRVTLAYPFALRPTGFDVVFGDGTRRWACCAVDALGIGPMLDEPLRIEARCHASGAPLALTTTPAGPAEADPGIMVWLGEREQLRAKACDSL
jgi:hypothetical protein